MFTNCGFVCVSGKKQGAVETGCCTFERQEVWPQQRFTSPAIAMAIRHNSGPVSQCVVSVRKFHPPLLTGSLCVSFYYSNDVTYAKITFLCCWSFFLWLILAVTYFYKNDMTHTEPFLELWLNPASDLVCKMFQNFWKHDRKDMEELSTNIWKYELNIRHTEHFFLYSILLFFSYSLALSLARSWKDCITACLTAWSTVWFCILTDYSVLFGFVLVILQRWILQTHMRCCSFSEWDFLICLPSHPEHSHLFTVRHFCTFSFWDTGVSGVLNIVKSSVLVCFWIFFVNFL